MKIHKKNTKFGVTIILIFLLLFILHYYLFFTWGDIFWFIMEDKFFNYSLFQIEATYNFVLFFTRLILSSLSIGMAVYIYKKSKNKKKFWVWYAIYLITFVLLTLKVFLFTYGAI